MGFTISDLDAPLRGLAVGDVDGVSLWRMSGSPRSTQTLWSRDASIHATTIADGNRVMLKVWNHSSTKTLKMSYVQMPWVRGSAVAQRRIWSAFRGGKVHPWGLDGYVEGTVGAWPNMGYSPFVAFYDLASGEGVAFMATNPSLAQTQLCWVTTPAGDISPFVLWQPIIHPHESASLTVELKAFATGLPEAGLAYYREQHLAVLMAALGVPEVTYQTTAPWAFGDWPSQIDPEFKPSVTPAEVEAGYSAQLTQAAALGAKGYFQWPRSDGKFGSFYEPWTTDFFFQAAMLPAKRAAGIELGVLVNPFVVADYPHFTTPKVSDLQAVRLSLMRQFADLKARGVTVAYWDGGTAPTNVNPLAWGVDWLRVLALGRSYGISLAPESSCDVAAWATGAVLHYPHVWGDYKAMKVVTPNATQFVVFPHATQEFDAMGYTLIRDGEHWWQDAILNGLVPVMTTWQLQGRAN